MSTHVSTRADLLSAVAAAIRAPSVHNTQPWQFRLGDDMIELYADRSRQLTVTDPRGNALRVSCGAAIFNVRLAVAHLGWSSQTVLMPDTRVPDLLARVSVDARHPPSPAQESLFAAIPRRHSNREPFLSTAVPLDVRARLIDAARAEGSWLDLIVGQEARYLVTELTRTADLVLSQDAAYRLELSAWSRRDDNAPDGVPQTLGGPAPDPAELVARRDFGGAPRRSVREFEADPLLAVLGAYGDSPADDLIAGQALQRVLLTATAAGLVVSLISQPIDVPHIREQLRLGLRRPGLPHMVLRFGYGVAGYSPPRRPVAEVLLPSASATADAGSPG